MLQHLGKLNEARKFQQSILHQDALLQDTVYIHAFSEIHIFCFAVVFGVLTRSWGFFLGILLAGSIANALFALTLKRVDQPYHLYKAWILFIPIIFLSLAWFYASWLFLHFLFMSVMVLACGFLLNMLLYFLIDIDGVGKLRDFPILVLSLLKDRIDTLKAIIREDGDA